MLIEAVSQRRWAMTKRAPNDRRRRTELPGPTSKIMLLHTTSHNVASATCVKGVLVRTTSGHAEVEEANV